MGKKNVGVLLLILILPVLIFIILRQGNTKVLPLPYYGEATIVDGDTTPYTVDLTRLVGKDEWIGKHLVFHFLPQAKSALSTHAISNLKKIHERLPEVDNIEILSIGFNQGIDFDLPLDSLWNLSKVEDNTSNWIENDLFSGYEKSKDYANDQVLVLVDKNRHVRGFFQAGNDKLDRDLLGELRVLLINDEEQ